MTARNMSFLVCLCTLVTACAGSPTAPAPVSDSQSNSKSVNTTVSIEKSQSKIQHIVKRGDTLYSLSKKYKVTFKQLAAYNQITAPYTLKEGQILQLTDISPATLVESSTLKNSNSNVINESEVETSRITQPGFEAVPEATINEALNKQGNARQSNATYRPPSGTGNQTVPDTDYEKTPDNAIQWQWPTKGKVMTAYDDKVNKGLNMSGAAGQAIFAAATGKVIYSGADVRNTGKLIIIKHNSNLLSVYAHQGNTLVSEGSMVRMGDQVASLPEGVKTLPILHFEIRYKGKPLDPVKIIP